MIKTALFIGRFQPFHKGHLTVVERALSENDELIIGIGSAEENYRPDNPFTGGERFQMIRAALDEAGIDRSKYSIIPVRNINNYALWVDHVELLVPPFKTVYTGSSIVKELFVAHGVYTVVDVDFVEEISGTETRQKMLGDANWQDALPPAVVKLIQKFNGVNRLKLIS